MSYSSRTQPPKVNLKERIAALEQRNAQQRPISPTLSPATTPSTLGTNANKLREKIAQFESKGGVPVPRGSFGLGAPPVADSGDRRRGELYGNRIVGLRSASAGLQTNSRPNSPLLSAQMTGGSMRSLYLSPFDLDDDASSSIPEEGSPTEQSHRFRELSPSSLDTPEFPFVLQPPRRGTDFATALDIARRADGESFYQNQEQPSPESLPCSPTPVQTSIPAPPQQEGDKREIPPTIVVSSEDTSSRAETVPSSTVAAITDVEDSPINSPNNAAHAYPTSEDLSANAFPTTQKAEAAALSHVDVDETNHSDFTTIRQFSKEQSEVSEDQKFDQASFPLSTSGDANCGPDENDVHVVDAEMATESSSSVKTIDDSASRDPESVSVDAHYDESEMAARSVSLQVDLPAVLVLPPSTDVEAEISPSERGQGEHALMMTTDVPSDKALTVAVQSNSSTEDTDTLSPMSAGGFVDFYSQPSSASTAASVPLSSPLINSTIESLSGLATRMAENMRDSAGSSTPIPSRPALPIPDSRDKQPDLNGDNVEPTTPNALLPPVPPPPPSPSQKPSLPGQLNTFSSRPISMIETSPSHVAVSHRVSPVTSQGVPVFVSCGAHVTGQPLAIQSPERTDFGTILIHKSSHSFSHPSTYVSHYAEPDLAAGVPRESGFSAVVHGKVREVPSHTFPVSKALPATPQKSRAQLSQPGPITSPGYGELSILVQDAALLESKLLQGELPSESLRDSLESPQSNVEILRAVRSASAVPVAPSFLRGETSRVSSKPGFRMPFGRSKSTNVVQRLPSDPPDEPPTPLPKSMPPSRYFPSLRRLASTSRSTSHGTYPRHRSISSEISSDDSMPVTTPPDSSLQFVSSASTPGLESGFQQDSTIAWPALSSKKSFSSLGRATAFAEKMFHRQRSKSSVSVENSVDLRQQFDEPMRAKHSSPPSVPALPTVFSGRPSWEEEFPYNQFVHSKRSSPPPVPPLPAVAAPPPSVKTEILHNEMTPVPSAEVPLMTIDTAVPPSTPPQTARRTKSGILATPDDPVRQRPSSWNSASTILSSGAPSPLFDKEFFDSFPPVPEITPSVQLSLHSRAASSKGWAANT